VRASSFWAAKKLHGNGCRKHFKNMNNTNKEKKDEPEGEKKYGGDVNMEDSPSYQQCRNSENTTITDDYGVLGNYTSASNWNRTRTDDYGLGF